MNGNATYAPNILNQYTSMAGSPVGNGSEHEIQTYNNVRYTYINDERLKTVKTPPTNPTYTYNLYYDALGRCVKRTLSSTTTYYIYDGEKPILEYRSTAPSNPAKNVYGKGIDEPSEWGHREMDGQAREDNGRDERERTSQILMRYDPSFNPTLTCYYQQDHEGSVTHLLSTSGDVIEKYKYDAFGVPFIYDANDTLLSSSAKSNRFMFTGGEYTNLFNFYEYRARAYNPILGRFMSEDPKLFVRGIALGKAANDWSFAVHPDEAELNLFRYCGNDPIDFTDPMGLDPMAVSNQEDTLAHRGLSKDHEFMMANQGFFGQHAYEYSTTVWREQATGKLGLSDTKTDGKSNEVIPPRKDGYDSVIETHNHGLDKPINDYTGSLLSERDVERGNQTGRPQYAISKDGKMRVRFRPDDDAARRAKDPKNAGGAIEEWRDNKWIPLKGANTDLTHPGAGKNWPLSP